MAIVLDGNLGITTPAETVQGALTTTGNTILGDASTDTLNVGNGGLVKDASGNVGIGTASPAFSLDVRGDGQKARFGNTTIGCTVGNYVGGTIWGFANNGGNGGMFGDASNYIYFASAGAERMRIDSSGNLLVGTTSSNSKVVVKCSSTSFNGGVQLIRSDADRRWELLVGGDDKFYLGYASAATPVSVGSFATNGVYTAISDVRKKKDINYEFDGLALVNALKPAMGRMLDDDASHPLRPFLIAQDTQPVLPSLVSSLESDQNVDNPILGVDYASVVPVLLKAIQELKAIVDAQAVRIAALES